MEIPAWIRNSEGFNLNKDVQFIKETEEVCSLEDFIQMIECCDYWEINYPDSLVEFIVNNKNLVPKMEEIVNENNKKILNFLEIIKNPFKIIVNSKYEKYNPFSLTRFKTYTISIENDNFQIKQKFLKTQNSRQEAVLFTGTNISKVPFQEKENGLYFTIGKVTFKYENEELLIVTDTSENYDYSSKIVNWMKISKRRGIHFIKELKNIFDKLPFSVETQEDVDESELELENVIL